MGGSVLSGVLRALVNSTGIGRLVCPECEAERESVRERWRLKVTVLLAREIPSPAGTKGGDTLVPECPAGDGAMGAGAG